MQSLKNAILTQFDALVENEKRCRNGHLCENPETEKSGFHTDFSILNGYVYRNFTKRVDTIGKFSFFAP